MSYRNQPYVQAAVLCFALVWAKSGAALDPTKCKAKVNAKDGVILVEAKAVTGSLLWGEQAGGEIFALFNNSGDCVAPGDPKKCQLGAAGTRERLYPPQGCRLYLKDTGDSSTCSAFVKNCSPGSRPCPSDMVNVGSFCIDKYEASVWNSPTGTTQYGLFPNDDYPCGDDGQDCANIFARSVAGVLPSTTTTWFQAQQACQNVGKRLPTSAEWQEAVAGTPDGAPCNTLTQPQSTGNAGCVSTAGVFDMVGNVAEWVADWVPRSTACLGWGAFSNDMMCLAGAATTGGEPGALIRGGDGTSGAAAGPFWVTAQQGPSLAYFTLGFRCAR
jgi:hypothetical protein